MTQETPLPKIPGSLLLALLLAAALFLVLAWGALGHGKIWDFDKQAIVGGGLLLNPERERLFGHIAHGSALLAISCGGLLLIAFLTMWKRQRILPRILGIAVLFFGGANLCTQVIKAALPAALRLLGIPFTLGIGFPSGHSTMVFCLVLTLLVLAPSRWRAGMVPILGCGAALVITSFFLAGYHTPSEILGAILLSISLGFLVMNYLPPPSVDASSRFERVATWGMSGLGLVWVLSGLVGFLFPDATLPWRVGAHAAYAAAWRMIAGSVLMAVGLGALRLGAPLRRIRAGSVVLGASLLLMGTLGDLLIQRAQLRTVPRTWEPSGR